MFTRRSLALTLAACLFTFTAAAQPAPAPQDETPAPSPRGEQRIFFSLNGLAEPGTQDLSSASSFELYEEPGQSEVRRRVGGGGAFDIGVAYRLGRHLGVGIGYTASSDRSTASVSGSAPHPLFFGRPRAFAVDVPGLRQRERAVHLHALWYMPITTAWDVTAFAGPSILNVSQDQIGDVVIAEIGAPFNAVNVGVSGTTTRRGSGAGVNIGADTTYILLRDIAFVRAIGAGLTLRYAGGSVDIQQPGGGDASVKAGGFQIGGGLRVRF